MEISKYLRGTPPKILFHYTDQYGLKGIVETEKIWATKAHYLNDSEEFSYAIELVKNILDEIKVKHQNKYEEIIDHLDMIKFVNVCLASFTENGNLLSQWRGYGGVNHGYSLGFHGGMLKRLVNNQNFILAAVIYNRDDQVKFIRDILKHWISNDFNQNVIVLSPNAKFEDFFAMLAPVFKNPSFAEEQEWRIVTKAIDCTDDNYNFRHGKNSLIPYYQIGLREPTVGFILNQIYIGPNSEQILAQDSLKSYLLKYGHDNIEIHNSKIPYRD